jgi:predicted TIM-barrel fold metal-dependent hydrolase
MIIDSHVHTIPAKDEPYPMPPGPYAYSYVKDHPVTNRQFVAAMDAADVDGAVVVHAMTHDNSYTADALKQWPGRLAGVCIVAERQPDAPERLRYWTRERGMRGVRLFLTRPSGGEQDWLNDPAVFPLWEEAQHLEVPICVQMTFRNFDRLREMLERFPRVLIALDHTAGAASQGADSTGAQALYALAANPRVHVKFSTGHIDPARNPRAPEFFRGLLDAFGAGRVMWGTNYPPSWDDDYGALLRMAQRTFEFATASERDLVFGGAAVAMWPELANARHAGVKG